MKNLEQKLREYVELNASEIYNGINPDCRKSYKAGAELLLPMLVEAIEALKNISKNKYGLQGFYEDGDDDGAEKYLRQLAFTYEGEARQTLKSINEKLEGVK